MAAETKTYYVRKSGSDLNDGLTKETAFLTVQHAIDISTALDSDSIVTVYIGGGDYTNNSRIVIIDTGNLENIDFNFIGDLYGEYTDDAGLPEFHSLYSEASDGQRDILFKNIRWTHAFMNSYPHASTIFYYHDGASSNSSNLTFDGCIFETPLESGDGYAGAVVFDWGGTGLVKNCLIDARGGIRWHGDSQKHGDLYCIGTFARPNVDVDLGFYHNTFYMVDRPESVINHFYGATAGNFNFEFLNNLIVGAENCRVYVGEDNQSAVSVSGDGNYFDRVGVPTNYPFYDIANQYLTIVSARAAGKETNSLHVDIDSEAGSGPALVAGTKYELDDGSPCIDLGIDLGVTSDILLRDRPYGSAPDTGCYELERLFILSITGNGNVSITRSKFQFGKFHVNDQKRRSISIGNVSAFFIAMNVLNLKMVFPNNNLVRSPNWNLITDGFYWN